MRTRPRFFDLEGCTHIGVHVEPIVSRRLAKVTDLVTGHAPVLNRLEASDFRKNWIAARGMPVLNMMNSAEV